MEHRRLGGSGLMVPALTLGTVTFGGKGERAFGETEQAEASRMVDLCFEHGLTMFDSADIYNLGRAEEILGVALKGRRDKALISTKATFKMSDDPNMIGSSRGWLIRAVEGSLRRLQTDYIDLFQLHGYDAMTPQDEVMSTLNTLVKQGKIRYTGVSNFSGWHLMKSLAVSDRYGWNRHVAHQAYYSLVGRDYEHELMGLGLAEGVGCVVWSPLGWGRLGGKYRRSNPIPPDARAIRTADFGPPVPDELFYDVMDALDIVAGETGKSVAQVALNWVLSRPTVATAIFGATSEKQLLDNIGAVGWSLTKDQVATLDKASERTLPYPYWHQASFPRNPRPV